MEGFAAKGSKKVRRQNSGARRGRLIAAAVAATAVPGVVTSVRADLTHRYSFSENGGTVVTDSIGGANGVLLNQNGNASIAAGRLNFGNSGTSNNINTNNYVDLPNNIAKTSNFTVEGWATWNGGGDWQRFFDFGTNQAGEVQPGAPDASTPYNGTSYFFVTPRTGNDPGTDRRNTFNGELRLDGPNVLLNAHTDPTTGFPYPTGGEHMFALTRDAASDTFNLYLDGVLRDSKSSNGLDPATIDQVNMWLGRSNWHGDPFYNGSMNEFRIYDNARTGAQISADFSFGPDALGASGTNVWQTAGSGNFASTTGWSLNHVPTAAEVALLDNGATVTVNSNVGTNNTTRIANGTIAFAAGGSLSAFIDLAPGNGPGSATLNLTGGTLTAPRILIDTGTPGGTGAKAININGGTLALTDTFTLSGTNLTTTIGASGGTISVTSPAVVNWNNPLTPAGPTATLTKLGAGSLLLSGSYGASVIVRAGTLGVGGSVGGAGSSIQIGDAAVPGGDNATLLISGTTGAVLTGPITVGTTGTGGTNVLQVSGNNNVSVPGLVTLKQNFTVTTAGTSATNSTTFTGGFTSGSPDAKTLTFNNAGTVNVATAGISDAGGGVISLVKNNGGVLFLQTPNTYSGSTTINGGAILFAAPSSIGGTGRSVTVNANGVAAAGPGFAAGTLNTTFFPRIVQSSAGVLALTADTSENIDFSPAGQNFPNAVLGAGTNVTYTGVFTPATGVYRLGGGGGTLTIPNAGGNFLTGSNALVVGGGAGGGTLAIAGSNNITGPITVQGGAVLSAATIAALGTPTSLTLNNGTFRVAGGPDFTLPATVTLAGPGTIDVTPTATLGGLTVTAVGQNAAPLTKTGPGTLRITGNVALGNNSFWMKQGTVLVDTGGVVNSTFFNSIGQNGNDNATLIVQGNGQYTNSHDFNIGDVGNAKGAVFIKDNAQIQATTFYDGKFNATQGVVVQTGGSLTSVGNGGEWRIGGGGGTGDAAAVGTYDMSAGTLSTTGNFQVGAFGTGSLYMTGGSATANVYPAVGRFPGGYGVLHVTGTGSFTQVDPARLMIVGEQGYGILNLSNGGQLTSGAPLDIGLNIAGTGVVNLGAGGIATVPNVITGGGGVQLNFHGGTLRVASNTPTDGSSFISPAVPALLWSEGGVIDTNGKDVVLTAPFSDPSGQGVTTIPVTNGGTGYVGHPVVKITGGGGLGASAVPVVVNGVVTAIQITNPGVGYSEPPTVTILGGGGTGATVGTPTLAEVVGGGSFTKTGAGRLTVNAFNSYTGNTVVNGGTYVQGTNGAIPTGANAGIVVVNGGATADTAGTLDLNGYDTQLNALGGAAGPVAGRVVNGQNILVTLTLGSANHSGTFGGQIDDIAGGGSIAVTKAGTGTQTLGGVNHYTGVTQVNGGTLRVTGSIATSSGVNVFDGTFEAAGTQTVKQMLLFSGKATVTGPTTGTARTVLTIGDGATDSPLTINSAAATVDVTRQALVYDFTASTTPANAVSEIRGHIIAGYNGGTWTGNGITSSAAATDPSKAVGYALATEIPGVVGGTFITKSGVDASSVLVRYTLAGDATLDGVVDFNDLVKLAQNYNTTVSASTQSWWANGDFTYDGIVDFNDLVKLAQNYNTALPAEAIPGAPAGFGAELAAAFASVPEPSVGLAAVAACGVAGLVRRRRRRTGR